MLDWTVLEAWDAVNDGSLQINTAPTLAVAIKGATIVRTDGFMMSSGLNRSGDRRLFLFLA
jgi:hypothetical protein